MADRLTPEREAEIRAVVSRGRGTGKYSEALYFAAVDLLAALERVRSSGWCDACAGTGKPVSGAPCMCGGTGLAREAVCYLRERLLRTERELDAAKRAVEGLRAIASMVGAKDPSDPDARDVYLCVCRLSREHEAMRHQLAVLLERADDARRVLHDVEAEDERGGGS